MLKRFKDDTSKMMKLRSIDSAKNFFYKGLQRTSNSFAGR
jgi:hypothetical protein